MPIRRIAVQPNGKGVTTRTRYDMNSTGSSPDNSHPGTPENINHTAIPYANDLCQRVKSASSRRCASPNIMGDITSIQAKRLKELYRRLSSDDQSSDNDNDDDREAEDDSNHNHHHNSQFNTSNNQQQHSPVNMAKQTSRTSSNSKLRATSTTSTATTHTPAEKCSAAPVKRVVPGEIHGGQRNRPVKAKPIKGNWVS